MEVKPGYKQTVVGVIPADWEVTTLAAVCSMKSGEGITSASIDQFSKYPCYGGNGLRGFTTRFTHDGRYTLIGRQGALCGNVLGVEGKFFASEHAIVVTASARTDSRWLTFVLGEMRLNQYSESSAQPGLSVAKLLSLNVARPPSKAEQEAIAEALSDADALIESLEQLIAKKRHIKQGAMQELHTGKKRLPGLEVKPGYKQTEVGVIPEDWEVVRLGCHSEITKLAGFEYSNHFNSYKDGGDIIVIRGTNITSNSLDLSDVKTIPKSTSDKLPRSKLNEGDLVFAYVGTIGPVFLIDKDDKYHLGPNTARITCKKSLYPRFLFCYFLSDLIRKEITERISTGAQPSLSMTKIRDFRILKPTNAEQEAIATILSDMDAEIAALEAKLAKARQLKQGMMQELLTGRIRLT